MQNLSSTSMLARRQNCFESAKKSGATKIATDALKNAWKRAIQTTADTITITSSIMFQKLIL